jgi:Mn2+/Fe2+ NRAMP family transporter
MAEVRAPSDPITIPEPGGVLAEPWSLSKVRRMAALFGPAAIVASVAIGAGETIVVVQAGSWAGYSLLWLVLASVLIKCVCVTYLLGRYPAVSGEPIGQRLVHMPGPRGWMLLAIIVLELGATGPLWAAIARPSGDLMFHLLERAATLLGYDSWHTADGSAELALAGLSAATWKSLFATAFVLAALVLSLGISFKWLERQQVIICGLLVLGTIAGTIMVRPDLWAALVGAVSFGQFPHEVPAWAPAAARDNTVMTMTTTFGYVGGSVMTYIAYGDWISLHGWGLCGHPQIDAIRRRAAAGSPRDYLPNDPAQSSRLRRLVAPLRWDVGLGALVLLVVSFSFMMAGAAVLQPLLASGQLTAIFGEWSLLTDQAYIWQNIHPGLVWVYYVCVLLALWGTLLAYPDIYTRVTRDFCAAIWPGLRLTYRRLQLGVCLYIFASAMPLLWIDVNFATLTAIVAFLATNAGVALAMVAALYLNFQLPPLYRTRGWMLAAGIVSAVVLLAVSAFSGWALVGRLTGALVDQ